MPATNVLGICGSLRRESANLRLLHLALGLATARGARTSLASIGDMALFDEDLEAAGWPEVARRFHDHIRQADAVLIATPEYNYSVSGALKNAIDWASRDGNAWSGKRVALMGVSSGPIGTARAQLALRQIMVAVDALVIPQPQVSLGPASLVFGPDGSLADEASARRLVTLVEAVLAR
ncbi:MAG: NAD(P)H-dependent oxidoreductase [Thermoanaerobaculaceae bacterium]|nr:NAD(P)H-dependent oxidoreductase [Thermoanaerobaculaceae bacterium]